MKNFKQIDKHKFNLLINKMRDIQQIFLSKFQVDDIWSNSKIFEILPFIEMKNNNYLNLDFGYHVWPRLIRQMAAY